MKTNANATLRATPAEEIATRAGGDVPAWIWPEPDRVFSARAMRLRRKAGGHVLGEWLSFVAAVCDAQQAALDGGVIALEPPPAAAVENAARLGRPPLPADADERDPAWRDAVVRIARAVRDATSPAMHPVLDRLLAMDGASLDAHADALLDGSFDGLDPAISPIVAAALQAHWTARLLELRARHGDARSLFGRVADGTACPCCGSPPVASVTRSGGGSLGQRYLQCSLCSLQWHLPRTQCPHCLDGRQLAFRSIDLAGTQPDGTRAAQAAVQAETCDACGHYLKIVHVDRDPEVEPVADDLATLTLDLLVSEAGYRRHGVDYLLLFGDAPAGPADGVA